MKKNALLLFIAIILGAITIYHLVYESSQKDETVNEREFSVKNIDDIHRIFMADRTGKKVNLVRKNDFWEYNGKYKARPNAIENLLETIRRVEVRYKPAKALEKQMIQDLGSNGIKVEIFGKKAQKLQSYYVGGVTPDETGTYMIKEGVEQPFVTTMSGFEGGLRVRYLLEERDWRDRTVFAVKEVDIQSVSVEYPKQKNKSFQVEREGTQWQVKPFYDINPTLNQDIKPGYIQAFLTGFENLVAESFENDSPIRDSISRLIPFCEITLTKKDGNQISARFHAYEFGGGYNEDGQAFSTAGGSYKNIERYLLELSTGDFMLVQDRVFQKVFWAYSFFFDGIKLQSNG